MNTNDHISKRIMLSSDHFKVFREKCRLNGLHDQTFHRIFNKERDFAPESKRILMKVLSEMTGQDISEWMFENRTFVTNFSTKKIEVCQKQAVV